MTAKKFDDMSQAFDYCRERDCPVFVEISQVIYRLFPSGRAEEWSRELEKHDNQHEANASQDRWRALAPKL